MLRGFIRFFLLRKIEHVSLVVQVSTINLTKSCDLQFLFYY